MGAIDTIKELLHQIVRVKSQVDENTREIKALRQDTKKLIKTNEKLTKAIVNLSARVSLNEEKSKNALEKLALELENKVLAQIVNLQTKLIDSNDYQLRSADLSETIDNSTSTYGDVDGSTIDRNE